MALKMGMDLIFTAGSGNSAKRTAIVSVSRPRRTLRKAAIYSSIGRKGGKVVGTSPHAGEVSWGREGVLSAGKCTDA